MRLPSVLHPAFCVVLLTSLACLAQPAQRDRIGGPIDNSVRSTIEHNIHPRISSAIDRGRVQAAMPMQRVTLVFKPSDAQQAELDALLQSQQDSSSPNYHKWLTPEQYADRFGVSQNDFNRVAEWLTSQGFEIVDRSRSRSFISFNATAQQVSSAFQTEIHQYVLNGETHYANATAPSLPAALANVVVGIRNLNNFRPKPHASVVRRVNPNFTSDISGNHFIAPDDLATIYNLKGLYNAGLDGAGQKIAVMGQTDLVLSDIQKFRSTSGLAASDPQVVLVPGSKDPGVVTGDIDEANLDIQWSGAVARGATIVYVNSANGAFDSLQYAVDKNVAPVISISYGACEPSFSTTDLNAVTSWGKQANAQGQTIVAASGDSGAADCDGKVTSAKQGLAVDVPAALPYVTGIGGTRFNEGTGTFWDTTNNSNNGSARSYIPEIVWNDTATDIANGGSLASTGGGASKVFSKPTWQTGTGVPNDGKRDVPDVSFAASADHDGYLVCSQGSCVNGYRAADTTLSVIGGTSAGAPIFAGMVALINQKTGSRQGNVNPALYQLAASTPAAFHDTTSGDNKVPCTAGSTNCPAAGGSIGFAATAGYDRATGLGSVDASALVTAWTGGTAAGDFAVSASSTTLSIARGNSGTASVSVAAVNGFTNAVALTCSVPTSLSGATCSVQPGSVTPGNAATVTITAPAKSAAMRPGPTIQSAWMFASLLLPVGFVFAAPGSDSRRKLRNRILLLALAVLLILFAVSCGGIGQASSSGQSVGTSPLSGTITIQGTSGTLNHSVQIAVTIS